MHHSADFTPLAPAHLEIEERGSAYLIRDNRTGETTFINRTGALVWCLCDGKRSVEDIVGTAVKHFPKTESVELDVLCALREFASQRLLTFQPHGRFPARLALRIEGLEREALQREVDSAGISATPVSEAMENRRLCVAMATYDDFDGVYFTVQSIRLYHPEVVDQIEFIVLDNNPLGKSGEAVREFVASVPNLRYIPEVRFVGTAVRGRLFELALAPWVLCLDCHVMLVPGALEKLLGYIEAHPDSPDLLQGPLQYDSLDQVSTHMDAEWGAGMYGRWAYDERGADADAPPFEISLQGLGLFACRRQAWPEFNPEFRGFGGEEGYIHEKFRQSGARTLCLPFLRWLHRFGRPAGVPYSIRWKDRVMNYLVGFDELGMDTEPVLTHFRELLTPDQVSECLAEYRELYG